MSNTSVEGPLFLMRPDLTTPAGIHTHPLLRIGPVVLGDELELLAVFGD
jgi:hypothetical protein